MATIRLSMAKTNDAVAFDNILEDIVEEPGDIDVILEASEDWSDIAAALNALEEIMEKKLEKAQTDLRQAQTSVLHAERMFKHVRGYRCLGSTFLEFVEEERSNHTWQKDHVKKLESLSSGIQEARRHIMRRFTKVI